MGIDAKSWNGMPGGLVEGIDLSSGVGRECRVVGRQRRPETCECRKWVGVGGHGAYLGPWTPTREIWAGRRCRPELWRWVGSADQWVDSVDLWVDSDGRCVDSFNLGATVGREGLTGGGAVSVASTPAHGGATVTSKLRQWVVGGDPGAYLGPLMANTGK